MKKILPLAGVALTVALTVFALNTRAAAPTVGTLDPVTVTAARSAADHEAIAAAYEAEAVVAEQKAKLHKDMGAAYQRTSSTMKPPSAFAGMVMHCSKLAKQYTEAAKLNRELAAEHREIAATLK